jgi:hypothetical protein
MLWVKALHQWASAKAKLFTSNAGAAAEELITCATSGARHAATGKPKPSEVTCGRQKLSQDREYISFALSKELFFWFHFILFLVLLIERRKSRIYC